MLLLVHKDILCTTEDDQSPGSMPSRHPHQAGRVMQHLSLAWRSLAEKNFVKSANAVAKLDLSKALAGSSLD